VFAAARHAPLSVETLLLPPAFSGLIVLLAPRVGPLAAVVLTTTERAAEIPPISIAWMRQKANSAVATVDRAACQIGMIAQDGIERQLILTNKRVGAVGLMPIRTK
jgi:hypothetical protein